MIRTLVESTYADVVLVVMNSSEPDHRTVLRKLWDKRSKVLFSLYQYLDRILFRSNPDPMAPACAKGLLEGTEVIYVSPRKTKFSDYFSQDEVENIKRHEVDVLIRIGFRILRGDILKASKYGIWSYHHGDNTVNRGGPPGYWESVEYWPVTGSILQILSEDLDAGKVLYRSWSTTIPFSLARNRMGYFWKSLDFVPRKLKQLYEFGPDSLSSQENRADHVISSPAPIYRAPTNRQMLKLLFKTTGSISRNVWRSTTKRKQWILMYRFDADLSTPLSEFNRIVPPPDRFWADPHIVVYNRRFFVFFEELIFSKGKAHISAFEIDENGMKGKPVQVLSEKHHLSYPFLFESDDDLFMIPESNSNSCIPLYKCEEFPDKWCHVENLIENVSAVDATVHFQNDKWWLFAGLRDQAGASLNDELCIFSSDRLLKGNWTAHRNNPVISDVRRARPAGPIFIEEGMLFRPSQNSSFHYGYGLNINRITKLSDFTYEEEIIRSITPDFATDIQGTHTYSRLDRLTVVDALTIRNKLSLNALSPNRSRRFQ
jgi:hypothetical protein